MDSKTNRINLTWLPSSMGSRMTLWTMSPSLVSLEYDLAISRYRVIEAANSSLKTFKTISICCRGWEVLTAASKVRLMTRGVFKVRRKSKETIYWRSRVMRTCLMDIDTRTIGRFKAGIKSYSFLPKSLRKQVVINLVHGHLSKTTMVTWKRKKRLSSISQSCKRLPMLKIN